MLPEEMAAAHQELKIGGKCTSFRGVEEHQMGNVFPALTGPVASVCSQDPISSVLQVLCGGSRLIQLRAPFQTPRGI